MKGQIGKVETLQDNSIKLSVTVQPENIPDSINLLKWRFRDVDVNLIKGDTITLPKAEYESLTSGKSLILDIKYLEFFKTIRTVADDAISEAEGA